MLYFLLLLFLTLFFGKTRKKIIMFGVSSIDFTNQLKGTGYQVTQISWNDSKRYQGSSVGPNITDARLRGKYGENFFVLRPENFDEKIGKVKMSDIALIVGNENVESELSPVTLKTYLSNFAKYASYATDDQVLKGYSSLIENPSEEVGIRFQAVFLKTKDRSESIEFYPETMNYQTKSVANPKNLILLCTSQGTFPQQDRPGFQPHYLHQDDDGNNKWFNHIFEARQTTHSMSSSQTETKEEKEKAQTEGKAVATVLGTQSMGVGFNRLMTIQIPLLQKVQPHQHEDCLWLGSDNPNLFVYGKAKKPGNMVRKLPYEPFQNHNKKVYALGLQDFGGEGSNCCYKYGTIFKPPSSTFCFGSSDKAPPSSTFCFGSSDKAPPSSTFCFGSSDKPPSSSSTFGFGTNIATQTTSSPSSARVSIGSNFGPITKIDSNLSFDRDTSCAITITVQFYFVHSGDLTPEDIAEAVKICDKAYSGCSWSGNLMDKVPETEFAKVAPKKYSSTIATFPCDN
jgi:hypothetical protein